MRRDSHGNKLYRKLSVKVIFPDNIFPPKTVTSRAEARMGFHDEGINDMLMQVADQLDTLYPFWEFKSVELAPVGQMARYVFTFAGYRATQPAQVNLEDFSIQHPQPAESKELGETEMASVNINAEVASEAPAIE